MEFLHIGDSGAEVGALQQTLVEAGYAIDAAELKAQVFASSTSDAVHAFQHAHLGPTGAPLSEDGVVGPMTAWALAHQSGPTPTTGYTIDGWRRGDEQWSSGVQEVLTAAIAEIGTHEEPDGSNRGPRVDVYTTPDLGEPWCAFFASWVWTRRDSGSPFGRIAAAQGIMRWGLANSRIARTPQAGDIFVIPRGPVHGHCGLICALLEENRVATVEGNASNAVRGLVRPIASLPVFVRPLGG